MLQYLHNPARSRFTGPNKSSFLWALLCLFFILGSPSDLVAQSQEGEAEAETEAETETEAEAEAADGKAVASIAAAAAAASSGSVSKSAAISSASVSAESEENAGVCRNLPVSNAFQGQNTPVDSLNITPQAGEVEAEVEVEAESEAEAEVGFNAASAGAGSSLAIGIGRTDIALPTAQELSLSYDASSSTDTDLSKVVVQSNSGLSGSPAPKPVYDMEFYRNYYAVSPQKATERRLEKSSTEEEVEAETEAESEAEAEAETGPGAAAAASTGAAGVGATGTGAGTESKVSTATSAISTDVVRQSPPEFQDLYATQRVNQDEERMAQAMRELAEEDGGSADSGNNNTSGLLSNGQGETKSNSDEAESEAEVEIEVEVEAEVNDNSAAVAAVVSGASGSSGQASFARTAAATAGSASAGNRRGKLKRNNDDRAVVTDDFLAPMNEVPEAEADAEVEAEAEASSRTNSAASSATTEATGGATAEAQTRMTSLNTIRLRSRQVEPFTDQTSYGSTPALGGELEIEVESEAEAEAEAEVGFESASAAAGAGAGLARNFISEGGGSSASASTSSTVGNSKENRSEFNETNLFEGSTSITTSATSTEAETEAEAEAEVGRFAGAASVSAAAAGYEDIVASTELKTSPFAAAAAAGAGQVVKLTTVIPANNQAGEVRASAFASDPDGRGVAVAVAVAGVPLMNGEDNEAEEEKENDFEAFVEVVVKTDPDDVNDVTKVDQVTERSNNLPDETNPTPPPGEADPNESEAEAETESEAEAGFGTAAAAAAASAAGPYAVSSTKTSTSTQDPELPSDIGGTDVPTELILDAALIEGEVILTWEAQGDQTFNIYYLNNGEYLEIGEVAGANPDGLDNYSYRAKGIVEKNDENHEFRVVSKKRAYLDRTAVLKDKGNGINWISEPYANPVKDLMQSKVAFAEAQHVKVDIQEISTGRSVATLFDGQVAAKTPILLKWIPNNAAPNGTYILSVVGDHSHATKKISLVR